jgi:hypothetical protein
MDEARIGLDGRELKSSGSIRFLLLRPGRLDSTFRVGDHSGRTSFQAPAAFFGTDPANGASCDSGNGTHAFPTTNRACHSGTPLKNGVLLPSLRGNNTRFNESAIVGLIAKVA